MTVRRRSLGRSGLSIPEIGFGCGPTAGLFCPRRADEQRAAVARALSLGIDYFDTAPVYGAGESEINLGRILRELRATPLIATKVTLSESDFGDISGAIVRSVEGSLERLGQPRITVLQLHNRIASRRAARAELGSGAVLSVADVLGRGGVLETFTALRDRGLASFLGCSAYGGEMDAVMRVVDSRAFDCLTVHYSILNQTAWHQSQPGVRDYGGIGARAAECGMGVIGLRALEAGLLAGQPLNPAARPAPDVEVLARRLASLTSVLDAAEPAAATALRFALSNPALATVLVGFSNAQQVDTAVAGAGAGALGEPLLSKIGAWRTAQW